MSTVKIEIDEPPGAILRQTNQPVQEAGREMEFIQHASRLGIPYIDMTEREWEAEMASLELWRRS
jgi:hypothetical protein